MPQQTFTVSNNPRVQIRNCSNRVTVLGWDNPNSVMIDVPARQDGDTITVENASRVMARVPRAASVTIVDCEGDVRVDDLTGRVELANVDGDVALRDLAEVAARDLGGDLIARGVASLQGEGKWEGDVAVRSIEHLQAETIDGDVSLGDMGDVNIERAEDDLSARGVRGALRINDLQGDASLRDVNDVHITHVEDDITIAGARGVVELPDVEGDVVVSLSEIKDVTIRADGDVVLNLPENANADIELDAPHGDVVFRGDIHITEQDDEHMRGTLGSGGTKVRVESTGDDVVVRAAGIASEQRHVRREREEMHRQMHDMGQQWRDMGQQIAQEVQESVQESLRGAGISHHGRRHRFGAEVDEFETPAEEKSRGPAPGSPERKKILDAIARGELNVDDAIRKLRGED